jgi:hypothetical protein
MALTARQERILKALYPLREAARAADRCYAVDCFCEYSGESYETTMKKHFAEAASALGYALVDKAVAEEGEVQP